jgi:hypothetical protein
VGERPAALQGDVIWHDASLNSAQLVDNMAPWHQEASMTVSVHKGPVRRSLVFMLVISSADVPGIL